MWTLFSDFNRSLDSLSTPSFRADFIGSSNSFTSNCPLLLELSMSVEGSSVSDRLSSCFIGWSESSTTKCPLLLELSMSVEGSSMSDRLSSCFIGWSESSTTKCPLLLELSMSVEGSSMSVKVSVSFNMGGFDEYSLVKRGSWLSESSLCSSISDGIPSDKWCFGDRLFVKSVTWCGFSSLGERWFCDPSWCLLSPTWGCSGMESLVIVLKSLLLMRTFSFLIDNRVAAGVGLVIS